MTELNAIAQLRSELGLTLAEMGELVGLSKSQMHEVERTGQASLTVALEIERLSIRDGVARIDAATLCEGVRLARANCPGGCGFEVPSHDGGNTPPADGAPTGLAGELSGPGQAAPQAARQVVV